MSLFGSLFGNNQPAAQAVDSPLDLATYAGSLASNPTAVDPILDRVRKITATHTVGQGLTARDEAELLDVYLDLEAYLTSSDPIRTFTKEELRGRLSNELQTKLNAHEAKGN